MAYFELFYGIFKSNSNGTSKNVPKRIFNVKYFLMWKLKFGTSLTKVQEKPDFRYNKLHKKFNFMLH